ncbi:MAG: CapA family protein [Clostridia bacterium]|nr:CapA family protein [Clostridia bacterium]
MKTFRTVSIAFLLIASLLLTQGICENKRRREPTLASPLRTATIRTLGDFVIHDSVFLSAERASGETGSYDFSPMLQDVWDEIGNADLTAANIDGCLGGIEVFGRYTGYPQFVTPESLLTPLRSSGVDMLTLSNNHMLDGWYDGLLATIENVENAGFLHTGANRTQEERDTPVIFNVNGIQIGFLNYTQYLNSMDRASGLDKRAMAFGVNAISNSDMYEDARRMRDEGAEVIVCFMHWGKEYNRTPDGNQLAYAKRLVECGVDVIIGGHPHTVQRAEYLTGTNQFGEEQKTLCVYSLGNFLSDQRQRYRDGGVIFDFTIREQEDGSFEIENPRYMPVWVWKTGTNDKNYEYRVMNIADYLSSKPKGMSDKDYKTMIQSYNDSVYIMETGIGETTSK